MSPGSSRFKRVLWFLQCRLLSALMAVLCMLSGASFALAAVDVGCSVLWIGRGSAPGCRLGSLWTLGSFRTFPVCILASLPRPHFRLLRAHLLLDLLIRDRPIPIF